MSYATHAALAESVSLQKRVVACAVQEGESNPSDWTYRNIWHLVGADWISAVESAQVNEEYTGDPFSDSLVVTDQMILSAVQARQAELFEPPKDK